MKSIYTYLSLIAIVLLASCGASNFKGYYPDNNITGKGTGNAPAPEHVVTSSDEHEDTELSTAISHAGYTVSEEAPIATERQEELNKIAMRKAKQETRSMKFAQFLMPNLSSMTNVDALSSFEKDGRKLNFLEKMAVKSYSKFMKKQMTKMGYDAARMPIEDIFAIVSLSAGGAAWITFYGVFLFGVAAVVFGIIALARGTSRRGMAIAGIVLGAVAYLLWIPLIFFVIYA